jgi:hypothetical protein
MGSVRPLTQLAYRRQFPASTEETLTFGRRGVVDYDVPAVLSRENPFLELEKDDITSQFIVADLQTTVLRLARCPLARRPALRNRVRSRDMDFTPGA